MNIPAPRFIVDKIFPEGLTILAGKAKTGKSYLMYNTILDVISGGLVLGEFKSEQCEILFLGLEDTLRRLKHRAIQLSDDIPKGIHITCKWDIGSEGRKDLEQYLDKHPNIGMVVVDTLSKVRGWEKTNKNSYQKDYDTIDAWAQIARERKISIVMVHHLNKNQENQDPLDYVNGTSGLTAACDNVMILTKTNNNKKCDYFLYIRGNDTEEQDIALSFDNGLWSYVGDATLLKGTDKQNDFLLSFEDDEEITNQKVMDRLECTNTNAKAIINRSHDNDLIKRVSRGIYKKKV